MESISSHNKENVSYSVRSIDSKNTKPKDLNFIPNSKNMFIEAQAQQSEIDILAEKAKALKKSWGELSFKIVLTEFEYKELMKEKSKRVFI